MKILKEHLVILYYTVQLVVQAALVIRGFGIRGFDYPRIDFRYQNLLFAVFFHFLLIIRGFCTEILIKI